MKGLLKSRRQSKRSRFFFLRLNHYAAGCYSIPFLLFNMDIELGIVGLGDMGLMYLKQFAAAGYRINVCDLPSKFEEIKEKINHCDFDTSRVHVFQDGFGVVRRSDFIVYSVEAAYISDVVRKFGPATKVNAIVSGQTSVKEPEIKAFDAYLPDDGMFRIDLM